MHSSNSLPSWTVSAGELIGAQTESVSALGVGVSFINVCLMLNYDADHAARVAITEFKLP